MNLHQRPDVCLFPQLAYTCTFQNESPSLIQKQRLSCRMGLLMFAEMGRWGDGERGGDKGPMDIKVSD